MLKANKSKWFEKLFSIYNRNLLQRKFNSLQIQNLEELKNADKNLPLIIYANHSSWWDGLIIFELLKSKKFDSYVLMEEKQLKKYRLFQKIGAFSIVRENSREAIKSLGYAIETLNAGKNKTLLIFPQGKIYPNDKRPLEFFGGLAFIINKLKNCTSIPCSIRFEFLGNFKPDIFVKFGNSIIHNKDAKTKRIKLTEQFKSELTQNLDSLKSDIIENKLDNFQRIF